MIALPPRLHALALGWGAVGVAYTLSSLLQGPGTVLAESALDRLVPFDPRGVWLYLSFFALIPYAYLRADAARVPWLMRAMQFGALVSGIVFVLFPTTLHYPPVTGASLSAAALRLLAAGDSAQNCLPSLHAALTCLAARALVDARRPWRSALVVLWSAAITWSIVQTRRHLALDISAGVLVALVCGMLAARLPAFSRRTI
ncbi:phosphatase PAP2 family protein [Burkholderia ubonensis]|uniref:Acid phosphatase n=1 Tax=Burkholderia ubonensis TaxID=101571 RepID=A0ABD6Q9T2_9BURK|nr:phosphatase PAP2 family protein [Burkholderia ubonensis]OJA50622.1 acid phosphatase [Burkholderia ubonensis]